MALTFTIPPTALTFPLVATLPRPFEIDPNIFDSDEEDDEEDENQGV